MTADVRPPVLSGRKQALPGQRISITKLMYKLMQVEEPNYIIAAAAEIHPTTLSQYSRGLKPISSKHLINLCKLFKCEPDELIGDMEVEIA